MASLLSPTILLLFLLFLHLSFSISFSAPASQLQKSQLLSRRKFISMEGEEEPASKPLLSKKKPILGTKNQTKLIKPKKTNSTTTISTAATPKSKLNKTLTSTPKTSNSTKLVKPTKLTKSNSTNSAKSELKSLKLSSNSTKSSKKILDPPVPRNKTATSKPATAGEKNSKPKPKPKSATAKPEPWLAGDEGDDLIAEFRDLPTRLQQSLFPDLQRLSTTSKAYLSRANREIAEGVKPFVGKSFAPKIASIASVLFLVLPLLLVTALFRRLRSYLSLHRLLVFIQAYLAIYFATLAVTALVTGLEPLRFFYATSPSSYAWTQAAQTFGYLLYLVVQLINLVVVFSAGEGAGAGARVFGLAQMLVGLAVGMHYYAAVFHRAVTGDPPRANWRVHAVYAACFLVICACARAERRKKTYLNDGGEDGKKS
ncbi:uncharacterized protein LOC103720235 [Phoenix dactylifera]|uniref:Uncharacterized protein LOC103720235 n=1 Tax=Phoenix dactylifera TaxID=42345 RepID=A0A8B8JC18_PHODC|nr:uncharacterized protein LOC103720235 [Phoenix dactylifera]